MPFQLKQQSIDLAQQTSRLASLEQDLGLREKVLSGNIAELVSSGAVKSVLYSDAKMATDTLAQAEHSMRMLQHERDTLMQDVRVSKGLLLLYGF